MDRLVAATTVVAGQTLQNEWRRDAGGLVTNLVYAPGKVVTKTFDLEGHLVSVRDWLGHEWAFGWDAAGRLTSLASPDGRTRTQTYDAAGRLASWRVGDLVGRSLEYDLAGRKTCDNVTAGAMPDPAEVRHAENTFDAADRLVSSVVEFGTGIVSTVTFAYDRNDAMVRAEEDGRAVAFRYDADGALAGVTAGGASEETFGYDAFGNRVLAGGHIWIPDQSDSLKRPLLECDMAGNLVRAYVWAGGMLLGYINVNGVLTIAHTDEQGGIVALSQTDGTVLHTAQYGPHGEDWGQTGTNPTPFAWLGGFGVQRLPQYTVLGDLYLTRHRLYAPAQQRFLSSDPMGLAGGLNLYAYGNGNPVAYVDPLGLCSEKTWWTKTKEYLGQSWDAVRGYGERWADNALKTWYRVTGHNNKYDNLDATLKDEAQERQERWENGTATAHDLGYTTGQYLQDGFVLMYTPDKVFKGISWLNNVNKANKTGRALKNSQTLTRIEKTVDTESSFVSNCKYGIPRDPSPSYTTQITRQTATESQEIANKINLNASIERTSFEGAGQNAVTEEAFRRELDALSRYNQFIPKKKP